jgi:hypothetical protein
MNDELDTLRSFRPEATGPTADLTLAGRSSLMEAIDAERSPLPAPRRRLPGRRGVRVALVFATALVAVGSVAAAAGLIPDDVQQSLGLAGGVDPAFTAQTDQAVQRASAASPDGGTIELWTAPTESGGTCAYLRHLGADGTPTDDRGVACETPVDGGARIGGFSETRVAGTGGAAMHGAGGGAMFGAGGTSVHAEWGEGRPTTLYGKAGAGATAVAVTTADGSVTTAPVTGDGWYLVVIPAGTDADSLRTLEARSASGTALATVPLHLLHAAPGAGVQSSNG